MIFHKMYYCIWAIFIVKELIATHIKDNIKIQVELGLVTHIENEAEIYFIDDEKSIDWSLYFRNPVEIFPNKLVMETARCNLGRYPEEKYLLPLLHKINMTWQSEINSLGDLIPKNKKHNKKRSLILGLGLLAALVIGYFTRDGISKFFHLEHLPNEDAVMQLSDRSIRLGSYVTKNNEQLHSLANSLCFFAQNRDDWLREREVNHHLSNYVRSMETTTLDLASGKLPPNRKIIKDLKNACLKLQLVSNELSARFCNHVLSSQPQIDFLGYSLTPNGLLQLDVSVKMPIVSLEMQHIEFAILKSDNIGFYSDNNKVRIQVPEYALLFNQTDQLVEIELPRCHNKICPVSSLKNTQSSMCLSDIFNGTLNSKNCVKILSNDEYCTKILIPGYGTLVSVRNGQFVGSTLNIYTLTLTNANKIVQKGRLICNNKITNFSLAIDGKEKTNYREYSYQVPEPLKWEFGHTDTFYHKLNQSIYDLKVNEFQVLNMPIKHIHHFTLTSISIICNFAFLIFIIHFFRATLLGVYKKIVSLFTKSDSPNDDNDQEAKFITRYPANCSNIKMYPILNNETVATQFNGMEN